MGRKYAVAPPLSSNRVPQRTSHLLLPCSWVKPLELILEAPGFSPPKRSQRKYIQPSIRSTRDLSEGNIRLGFTSSIWFPPSFSTLQWIASLNQTSSKFKPEPLLSKALAQHPKVCNLSIPFPPRTNKFSIPPSCP